MTLRALFFDLDDTLCMTSRTRPERARLAFEALRDVCPDLAFEEFAARLLAPNPATGFIAGSQALLSELGVLETPAGRRAHGLFFFDGCSHLIRPYDGMRAALDALSHDFWLGVITNGEPAIQRRKFDALDIEAHFQLFLPSGEIGHHKPARQIFEHALSQAGVAPHEAVMIGDNLEADVRGAREAGLRSVWFNAEGQVAPAGAPRPDATVTAWAELQDLLWQWRG